MKSGRKSFVIIGALAIALLLMSCGLVSGGLDLFNPSGEEGGADEAQILESPEEEEAATEEENERSDREPTAAETTAVETGKPTPSPTPTFGFTPTATENPISAVVNAASGLSCTSHPDPDSLTLMVQWEGDSFPVIGQTEDGAYLYVHLLEYDRKCWVPSELVDLQGPVDNLAYVTPIPPTPTTAPPVVWGGLWMTKLGDPDGEIEEGIYEIDLIQEYDFVTGEFYDEPSGLTIEIEGYLEGDFMTLDGTYFVDFNRGPFIWIMINNDQFMGNNNEGGNYWCGYRNDAGFPEPCMGP